MAMILRLRQAMQALGLSEPSTRALIKNGTLPATEDNHVRLHDLLEVAPATVETLLLTTGQAAELLDVETQTVRNMADRGQLPIVRIGSHRRCRLAEVLALGRDRECTWTVGDLRGTSR